jgi:hypothetical protein
VRSVCSRSVNATFSYTDMSVKSAPNWNSIPSLRRNQIQLVAIEIGHRLTRDEHAAGLRLQLAADQAQDRRLAATRAAHDADDAAAWDGHRDAREHGPSVVGERDAFELDCIFGMRCGSGGGRPRRGLGGHRFDLLRAAIVAQRRKRQRQRRAEAGSRQRTLSPVDEPPAALAFEQPLLGQRSLPGRPREHHHSRRTRTPIRPRGRCARAPLRRTPVTSTRPSSLSHGEHLASARTRAP